MNMRGLILVIDAFGIGAAPDADQYGDTGAHTLRSVCAAGIAGGRLAWQALPALGLGNCAALTGTPVAGCPPVQTPLASFGAMAEKSRGKDTTTGHWELAGIVLERGFHVFPAEFPSFPGELVKRFEGDTGYKLIGNRAASGTKIIEELGPDQQRDKALICYTSADSVFQIAAHEHVVPLDELYRCSRIARKICDEYDVARVIARPFKGHPGAYVRTAGRKDYSIDLPGPSMLDQLAEHGVETVGIGKIGDIFNHRGLALSHPEKGNSDCLTRLHGLLEQNSDQHQLVFVNLVDTDMLYGHRRDSLGYYRAIEEIDSELPKIIKLLGDEDFLVVCADHGCDPNFRGSDHTREYVPLLFYQPRRIPVDLGIRKSFADVAATVCKLFGIQSDCGKPFLSA
ncbi:MAG: phosphopentomutase [Desulfocapsaceae bacterium]